MVRRCAKITAMSLRPTGPRDAVIVEAVRTPIGRRNGRYANTHAVRLGASALRGLLDRAQFPDAQLDDIIAGCVTVVGEQARNIGRNVALLAGIPDEVPATTVDRQCGSSQQAIHFAAALIESGADDVIACFGVEAMSRIPLGTHVANGPGDPHEELRPMRGLVVQGIGARMIADEYGIDRAELDRFSVESHRKAAAATQRGDFRGELVPVSGVENGVPGDDEGIRPDTSMEKLATLKPAFEENGSITAGNSSQISDGAAAVLLMSRERAEAEGRRPRARIAAHTVVGVDPVTMLKGPIPATRRLLQRSGVSLNDVALFEVNEAFASVPLAWLRDLDADPTMLNVLGGAIALGHPVGSTGARLTTTLLNEMERRDVQFGVVAMCCGGGLGTAMLVERN
jgi:acetyl-CoA acyltransferase